MKKKSLIHKNSYYFLLSTILLIFTISLIFINISFLKINIFKLFFILSASLWIFTLYLINFNTFNLNGNYFISGEISLVILIFIILSSFNLSNLAKYFYVIVATYFVTTIFLKRSNLYSKQKIFIGTTINMACILIFYISINSKLLSSTTIMNYLTGEFYTQTLHNSKIPLYFITPILLVTFIMFASSKIKALSHGNFYLNISNHKFILLNFLLILLKSISFIFIIFASGIAIPAIFVKFKKNSFISYLFNLILMLFISQFLLFFSVFIGQKYIIIFSILLSYIAFFIMKKKDISIYDYNR